MFYGGREPDSHIEFDLNRAAQGEEIPTDRRFDLVVFAETLEHLHAAPELVFMTLRGLLKPDGVIICQTPNAAALPKRIRLVMGKNPYERIRIDERNPGHFREYTRNELEDIANLSDFRIVFHEYTDYFGISPGLPILKRTAFLAYRTISSIIPSFRRGQTAILRPTKREARTI